MKKAGHATTKKIQQAREDEEILFFERAQSKEATGSREKGRKMVVDKGSVGGRDGLSGAVPLWRKWAFKGPRYFLLYNYEKIIFYYCLITIIIKYY